MIKKSKNNKGFLLYLALALSGAFVLVAAALSSIMIGELRISIGAKNSMEALASSASLIDLSLYEVRINSTNPANINCSFFSGLQLNCASVSVDPNFSGSSCPYVPSNDCTKIEATGKDAAGKVFRKLEAIYGNL